jgi:hypothetical protein
MCVGGRLEKGLKLISLGAAVLCLWLRFKSVEGGTLANREKLAWTIHTISKQPSPAVVPLHLFTNRVVFVLPAQHIEEVREIGFKLQ